MTQEIIIKSTKIISGETPEQIQEQIEKWKKALVMVANIFPPDTLLEFLEDLTTNHPKVVAKIQKGQKPSEAMMNDVFGNIFSFRKKKE